VEEQVKGNNNEKILDHSHTSIALLFDTLK